MSLFSVPIFFIVFRETLEAAIIVSVLLGLVEQIARPKTTEDGLFVHDWRHPNHPDHANYIRTQSEKKDENGQPIPVTEVPLVDEAAELESKKLIKKLRIQIFLGAALGLIIALAIGAAFIAVWFTQASDLWSSTEELWEGIFSLIAAMIIMPMALTMLKLDRARAAWKVKLQRAFDRADRSGRAGRFVLFGLPLITVLREGLEAVVFVGGVSLGQSARSIPIAAIVGLICGLVCGYLIYAFASRATLTTFLVAMTNFLLLIGAGLFSKAVGDFQRNAFNKLLGSDVDDAGGDGPGSYDVRGAIWHLDCCNPENNTDGTGWGIFNALFGWDNTGTVGTVLAYIFYWLTAAALLVYMKFSEGRTTIFGYESAAGHRRRLVKEASTDRGSKDSGSEDHHVTVGELPR